ncbi:hypothetical protein C0Q70_14681 [Pomacea canaliculata]|uniref:U8 snoRNA-decapping enzyme n=1 Tax=Pomacea canaliculata TaxID=400727 RepID=A0A2T7NSQ6_POMCA|nr:hypothetical protein C0Q70_14681 [Pomacea canaliculata]
MENSNWGQLSKFEKFGRPGDDEMSFVPIDYDYLSALMQVRFDGLFGFPGGLVEPEENPVDGLNREMAEEIGLDVFGIVRVPLFTMGDGVRGFPAFLSGHFAGSARQELILGLRHVKLLSEDELNAAIVSSNKFLSQMIVKK